MSAKTVYISEQIYRELPTANSSIIERVEGVIGDRRIVNRYASNVESDLQAHGEHKLAKTFLSAVKDACFIVHNGIPPRD